MRLIPNSQGALTEFNTCHDTRGRFCSGEGWTAHEPAGWSTQISRSLADFDFLNRLRPAAPVAAVQPAAKVTVSFREYPPGLPQRLFGSMPVDTVVRRLSASTPGKVRVMLHAEDDAEKTLSIYISGTGFDMKRTFDVTDSGLKVVRHNVLSLQPGTSNRGMGKRIIRDAMALYKELGYHMVDTYADIDVGAYAWARYGFAPEDLNAYQSVAAQLENEYQAAVVGRPRQMYYDESVSGRGSREVTANMTFAQKKAVRTLISRIANGDRKAFWALADASVSGRREDGAKVRFKLGKWLLKNTTWYGRLDLWDTTAMARLHAYVGQA